MKVDNAIIMAAGVSSRFAPLSYERPKALIEVKGEILIERQIRQLREAGVPEIIVVTGYMAEKYSYLRQKLGVTLVYNPEFDTRNNNGSLWYAKDLLKNTYICSADNYFNVNPFERDVDGAYYSALYAEGHTAEWCMEEDAEGHICSVTIGGENAWYMLGHAFFSEAFSRRFVQILTDEYMLPETAGKYWETIFMEHLNDLKMKIRRYPNDVIFEFDSLDELRVFDESYICDTRSALLKKAAEELGVTEDRLVNIRPVKNADAAVVGFSFDCGAEHHTRLYHSENTV